MEKRKTWFLQVGAWCLDSGPEHQSHLIRKTDCLYENNCGKMSKEGMGWFAWLRSLAWRVLRELWLATSWVARQPSEDENKRDALLGSEIILATTHVNQISP